MADPDHHPDLDGFDRLTVALYRTGLAASAVLLLAVSVLYGLDLAGLPGPTELRLPLLTTLAAATTLSTVCVHLYDKRIRWLIAACAPLGLSLLALGGSLGGGATTAWVLQVAGVGFAMVSLSALAFKEWFCFRIPGLRLVPVLLGVGVFGVLLDLGWLVVLLWAPAGLLIGALTVAKLRMPLGHDIGDRARYQV